MKVKQWVEIPGGEHNWLVDMNFMLSGFGCSWGCGCQGISSEPEFGCCKIGASLLDSELEKVKGLVAQLTDAEWQYRTKKWHVRSPFKDGDSHRHTAVNKRANGTTGCVFSNSPDFPGGAGCAFHIAAVNRGDSPLDWKPEVCWTVPIYASWVEELGVFLLRMQGRADWTGGEPDYDAIKWWCTDDSVSWGDAEPFFVRYWEELQRITDGLDNGAWRNIEKVCQTAWNASPKKTEPRPVPVTLVTRT